MALRRGLLLALVLYLTADYCDPSIPGVFFFGAESFFVESVESRSAARPVLAVSSSPSPRRAPVKTLRAPLATPEHARAERRPYSSRAHIVTSPPAAPGTAEDH